MKIHDAERVERLRTASADGLRRVAELEAKVERGELPQLTAARGFYQDVDALYLSPLGKEERTFEQEAHWLDGAELYLKLGNQYTDAAEKLINPYGDNVHIAGDG